MSAVGGPVPGNLGDAWRRKMFTRHAQAHLASSDSRVYSFNTLSFWVPMFAVLTVKSG